MGDGDSSSFGTLNDAILEIFGDEYDIKKECFGHIQKRMGTALRNWKATMMAAKVILCLSDGKGVGGCSLH